VKSEIEKSKNRKIEKSKNRKIKKAKKRKSEKAKKWKNRKKLKKEKKKKTNQLTIKTNNRKIEIVFVVMCIARQRTCSCRWLTLHATHRMYRPVIRIIVDFQLNIDQSIFLVLKTNKKKKKIRKIKT
jgi:hypothetical protein